jgi:DNA-binding winged helix-turn-helix (wHTH) protein
MCLHENMGFLVPYERLCAALGHRTATAKGKHTLQQHIMTLRRLLSDHAVPYAVAAVSGTGYTLCYVREPENSKEGQGVPRSPDLGLRKPGG